MYSHISVSQDSPITSSRHCHDYVMFQTLNGRHRARALPNKRSDENLIKIPQTPFPTPKTPFPTPKTPLPTPQTPFPTSLISPFFVFSSFHRFFHQSIFNAPFHQFTMPPPFIIPSFPAILRSIKPALCN